MKVQKKLTVIVIMVLLTIAALGTSTYAWFTLSNTAKVDQIDMGITSGVGIEVSLDGKEWFNVLDNDKITEKVKDVRFESITSTDGFTMSTLDKTEAPKNAYINFTIYFRASNVNQTTDEYGIYLSTYNESAQYDNLGVGTALKSEGVTWKPDVDYIDWDGTQKVEYKTTDESKKYYVENSMRVSFKDTTDGTIAKIFDLSEKSNSTHRGYKQVYGTTDDEKKVAYGAYSYYNNKKGTTKSSPENAEDLKEGIFYYADQLTKVEKDAVTDNNNSLVCKLAKQGDTNFYVGSTELRVWTEGWDIDCFDSILNDKIKLQMQFQFGKIFK